VDEPQPDHMEPELGDAYGSLLMAALDTGAKRGQVFEVVERDDGHSDAADAARYFAPRWGAWDDWAYERARGRVLDVGSGAGRHALELQERGCEVVALDVSPLAAEVCRRRGVANAFVGTIQELAASRTHQRFDTFLLMGNNLGLLESAERAPGFPEPSPPLLAMTPCSSASLWIPRRPMMKRTSPTTARTSSGDGSGASSACGCGGSGWPLVGSTTYSSAPTSSRSFLLTLRGVSSTSSDRARSTSSSCAFGDDDVELKLRLLTSGTHPFSDVFKEQLRRVWAVPGNSMGEGSSAS
jgi:hypothetical protein